MPKDELPSLDDFTENPVELPSVDEFITEEKVVEELPSVDEYVVDIEEKDYKIFSKGHRNISGLTVEDELITANNESELTF